MHRASWLALGMVAACARPSADPSEDRPPSATVLPASHAVPVSGDPEGDAGTPIPPPPSRAAVTALALGDVHSCALHADGLVSCWGGNYLGQLGDGTRDERAVPVRASIADVVEIAATGARTCARKRDGSVWCWGSDGNSGEASASPLPVKIGGLEGATQISAFCAVAEHRVLCFPGPEARPEATEIKDAVAVASISIGPGTRWAEACVLRANGHVACFPPFPSGFPGGAASTTGAPARPIAGVVDAVSVVAGDDFACARLRGGTVTCWGANYFGQLGRGATVRQVPQSKRLPPPLGPGPVVGARDAVSLVAGRQHACIVNASHHVLCWGSGVSVTPAASPVLRATEVPDVVATVLATGRGHTCVVRADGSVACWGAGSHGQLGMGWASARAEPNQVPLGTEAASVVASVGHTCVRKRNGMVACWGNGDPTPHDVPGLSDIVQIQGEFDPCARDVRGQVYCLDRHTSAPRPIAGVDDAIDLSATQQAGCAVRRNGGVVCWGSNIHGHFGNGRKGSYEQEAPQEGAVGISDALTLSLGSFHTCVVRRNGSLSCCSDFSNDGLFGKRLLPEAVPGFRDLESAASGISHVCGLKRGGHVVCAGENDRGQLGDGTTTRRNEPTEVPGLDGVVQIAAGGSTTCARRASGAVWCWGRQQTGWLHASGSFRTRPTEVPGVTSVVDVSVSHDHSCVVGADGMVACWGRTEDGEIGGVATKAIPRPITVLWP